MKAIAVVLIVFGILAIGWGGLQWTQREKVIDVGPVEVTREKQKTIPLPPILGIVALIAGGAMMMKR